MPNDPKEEALNAEIGQLYGLNFLMLVGLMASANPAMKKLYDEKIRELQQRTHLAEQEVIKLPQEQQLDWWLAHFERVNQEVADLIRNMRAACDV